MTLRTITFDDSTHKLVPLEPTEDQLLIMHERNYDMQNSAWFDKWLTIYKSGIAAAPEYQDIAQSVVEESKLRQKFADKSAWNKLLKSKQDTKKDEL